MKKHQKLDLKKIKIAKISHNLYKLKGGSITDSDTIPYTEAETCNTCPTMNNCNTDEAAGCYNQTQTGSQKTRAQETVTVVTCGIDPTSV
ncbi:MAG: hypothetical protein AB8B65_15145 [Kordia sp.]|uniref:hypothetical protein n=1 Tax=Kordia sp. TaxID=1965332 RepID=UPI00385D8E7B